MCFNICGTFKCWQYFSFLSTAADWHACRWASCPVKAWALLIKVASLFKFLIHMLIRLPAFSDWPTTVIIVSHHRVALPAPSAAATAAAAAAQQFRKSKLKPRLITIKARHKYYAFVPETIIATIPFRGARTKKKLHEADDDRHHFVSRLAPRVLVWLSEWRLRRKSAGRALTWSS